MSNILPQPVVFFSPTPVAAPDEDVSQRATDLVNELFDDLPEFCRAYQKITRVSAQEDAIADYVCRRAEQVGYRIA